MQRTPAEWALRWVWNRPEVTVVLSGMNDEAKFRYAFRIISTEDNEENKEAGMQLFTRLRGQEPATIW